MFTSGVLVPVVNLINGTSIVFESADDHETLDFFPVALPRHEVLDAQGAACESWRDAAAEEPCAPLLSFYGGRDELRSRLRSAASIIVDRRQPLDIIRDSLEERGLDSPARPSASAARRRRPLRPSFTLARQSLGELCAELRRGRRGVSVESMGFVGGNW